jgi:hypothetical protein
VRLSKNAVTVRRAEDPVIVPELIGHLLHKG